MIKYLKILQLIVTFVILIIVMMPGIEFIRSILSSSSASGSKTNIMKPLNWLISILGALVIGGFIYGLPMWMDCILFVCLILVLLYYLFVYTYCLLKDKDALRSERFNVQKMAIEKGILGDSSVGIIDMGTSDVKGHTEEGQKALSNE